MNKLCLVLLTARSFLSKSQSTKLNFLSPVPSSVEGEAIGVNLEITGMMVDEVHADLSLCIGIKQQDDGTPFSVSPEDDALYCRAEDIVVVNGTVPTWSVLPTIRLKNVPMGSHAIWAILRRQQSVVVGDVAVQRFSVVPRVFEPSYEWRNIVEGQAIESGLEVRMDLGPGHKEKQGRIPNPWRLQVWLPESNRFMRHDIAAGTFVRELVGAARTIFEHTIPDALPPRTCVRLVEVLELVDDDTKPRVLSVSSTALDVGLFEIKSNLHFEILNGWEDNEGCG